MKKTMLLVLIPLLVSCGQETVDTEKKTVAPESNSSVPQVIELFPDNKFEYGFNAFPGNKSFDDGSYPENDYMDNVYLKYTKDAPNPIWQLQQTGCIYDLNDFYNPITEKYPEYVDGYYKFEGVSNHVYVNPSIGEIKLGVEASKEYQHPRKDRENWPHLLLQNALTEQVTLSELSSLDFTIDLNIHCENKMADSEYNPGLHTAQFLMYFIVNTMSDVDSGDYFWFGVPFFDYRYKATKPTAFIDNGTSGNTGKVIYQMATDKIDPNGFQLDHDYSISLNLIEEFQDALLATQKLGRMTNTTVNDLSISNMNIGFEIPGTFDVEATFKNFSLKATRGA